MFKMRILITVLMLLKCSIDDIKTGYVNLRIIIQATIVGAGVFVVEDIALGRGMKRLWIYSVIAMCLILWVVSLYTIRRHYRLCNDMNNMNNMNCMNEPSDSKMCQFADKYTFIGTGDLIVFASITAIMGIRIMVTTALIAFFVSSLYSMYLVIAKHARRYDGFPFMPFILMGFIFGTI